MNRKIYEKMLGQVCSGSCCCKPDSYCFLKEFMLHSVRDPRTIIQLKCIEKFKWEESEKEGKDIGWQEAHIRWVEKGLAANFAKAYNEELNISEIYLKTIQKDCKDA